MSKLFAIAAVGRSGQLGLNGALPWHDREDLMWFREMTMGHECVVGHNTALSLPPLPGRLLVNARIYQDAEALLDHLSICTQHVYLIGGAKTYAKFAPIVDRWYINRVEYDGPADTWFDPEWVIAR
ncbi:MAG: dihydrofolate reductase [Aeromonadaceae bacterium]